MDILFVDNKRQDEIETFYEVNIKCYVRHKVIRSTWETFTGPGPGPPVTVVPQMMIKPLVVALREKIKTQHSTHLTCLSYLIQACQRHRSFYKGDASSRHPLVYFNDPQYMWQCPPEMTPTYLGYPSTHVRYKQPVVLPGDRGRTSGFPSLPSRTLAGRYNKAACKAFIR